MTFEALLSDLGGRMNLSLSVDSNQACRLEFYNGIAVQIDLEADGKTILIASDLGQIFPGIYRDRLFRQALKTNALMTSPRGILAFSEKNHSLVLYQSMALDNLIGDPFYKFLLLFAEHARIWTEAIQRGEIPQLPQDPVKNAR